MTTAQNKAVWASANRLGIDSEMLHEIIKKMFGVDSLKKVDKIQAIYLLRRLNDNNSPYSMEYASHKQIAKIKALFNECGFKEPKRKEWLFRAKSLKSEMNIAKMASNEIVKKLKQKEATSLIASLIKVQKYLESK